MIQIIDPKDGFHTTKNYLVFARGGKFKYGFKIKELKPAFMNFGFTAEQAMESIKCLGKLIRENKSL